MENQHPLLSLLTKYYADFVQLKDLNEDLDNMRFQRQFGLSLSIPETWPLSSAVQHLVGLAKSSAVVIIYSSTEMYHTLSQNISQGNVSWFSWHEFYVAMDRAGRDTRELQRFRHILQNAKLTVFCGAPSIPEVVDHIRGFCEGCLVILT